MTRDPPSNIPAEQALLGAILANNKAYDFCRGLQPEHFADDINRELYRACQRRIEAGRRVDAVTLWSALQFTGLLDQVGGAGYLTGLTSAMVMISGVTAYAESIRDCAVRRALIAASEELMERAYGSDLKDGDGQQSAVWGVTAIEQAATLGGGGVRATMATAVQSAINQSEAAQRGDKAAAGLLTGIPTLDEMWAGLYPGSLDIVGARPKTGKTSLACQIARKVARDLLDAGSGCVGFFSLEMPAEHLGLVNLASMTGISADDIRRGRYNTQQAHAMILAQRELAALPIEIIDRPRLPLLEAIGEMRTLKRTRDLRLVIVDHRNRFGRDEQFARMSTLDWYREVPARLKDAAKMLNVPIILLVQIGRGMEGREDPRPRISDLEYGGEQDADNVLLLYRPELHMGGPPPKKPNEREEDHANRLSAWHQERAAQRGLAEVVFAKRRFGPEGICQLKFDGPRTTFGDMPIDRPVATADLWSEEP